MYKIERKDAALSSATKSRDVNSSSKNAKHAQVGHENGKVGSPQSVMESSRISPSATSSSILYCDIDDAPDDEKTIDALHKQNGNRSLMLDMDESLVENDSDDGGGKSCATTGNSRARDEANVKHDNARIPNTLIGAEELTMSWFRIKDDAETEKIVNSAIKSSLVKEEFDVWDNMQTSWKEYFMSKRCSDQYFEKLHTVGMRYAQEKNYYQALKAFESAKSACAQKEQLADIIHNIGVIHMRAGRFHPKSFQRAALARKESTGVLHQPLVLASLVEMGISLFARKKYADALKVFKETLRIGTCMYGKHHFFVSKAMNNIGCTEFAMGNNKEALQAFQESLENLRPKFSTIGNNLDTDVEILLRCADIDLNIGYILAQGRSEFEAYNIVKEAFLVQRAILGENDCNTLFTSEKMTALKTFLDDKEIN